MSDGTAGLSAGDLNRKRGYFGLETLGGNSKKIQAFGGVYEDFKQFGPASLEIEYIKLIY